jgi:hypothetical protein
MRPRGAEVTEEKFVPLHGTGVTTVTRVCRSPYILGDNRLLSLFCHEPSTSIKGARVFDIFPR